MSSKLDQWLEEQKPKYVGPPPQCVTCSKFVAVSEPGTRRLYEHGDYGTVLSVEFECARCVNGRGTSASGREKP